MCSWSGFLVAHAAIARAADSGHAFGLGGDARANGGRNTVERLHRDVDPRLARGTSSPHSDDLGAHQDDAGIAEDASRNGVP